MTNWLKRHLQVLFYTLGQFYQNSLSVGLTLLALGIGASIPIIMYSVIDSLSNIGGQWQERPQITLYLEHKVDDSAVEALKTQLSEDARIQSIEFISAEQGLAEFSAQHQFEQAIALLDTNPLPDVFVVYPKNITQANEIAQLSNQLSTLTHVASAQYDFEWLQKLSALTEFLKRAIIVLASIIGIGITLLITNTIRLEINIRSNEIEIIDQLGGTPAFIARPFLYMGLLEGLFGGISAMLISGVVLKLLSIPLFKLANLYGFHFELYPIRLDISIVVLLTGCMLGWLAARFTVLGHLRKLKPI